MASSPNADLPTGQALAQRVIQRLRHIVRGNGIDPEQISLTEVKDMPCRVRGELAVALRMEIAQGSDAAKGASAEPARRYKNRAEMDAAMQAHAASWRDPSRWQSAAKKALQSLPGYGWGMGYGANKAHLPLDEATAWFEADETCPRCAGQGGQTCPSCQGRRWEICPDCHGLKEEQCTWCHGTRQAQNNPQEVCSHCQGKGKEPCRRCRATGQIPCRPCQGRGKLVCELCKGGGSHRLRLGARASMDAEFRFVSELREGIEIPRRVKKALQRFGPSALASQGHVHIEAQEMESRDNGIAIQPFIAQIPFAQLRLRIGSQEMEGFAFGCRAVPLDLPPFLDASLQPQRQALQACAKGHGTFATALETRVMQDALRLTLSGSDAARLRAPYAPALSLATAQSVMSEMKTALHRLTRQTRWVCATLIWLCAALIGIGWIALSDTALAHLPASVRLTASMALLACVAGSSIFAFKQAIAWRLRQVLPRITLSAPPRLPRSPWDITVPLGVVAVYLLCLLAASSVWL